MPDSDIEEKLGNQHYVTIVLRLLLDESGNIVRGEVQDADARAQRRFTDWAELLPAVRSVAKLVGH